MAVPVLQAPEATEKVKEKGLGVGAIRGVNESTHHEKDTCRDLEMNQQ